MKKIMWAQILCYENQGIHWYHCNPTFLWQINFRLVRRLISALIWDISGLWNRSDGRDFREKRIDISRFLALYMFPFDGFRKRFSHNIFSSHSKEGKGVCGWPKSYHTIYKYQSVRSRSAVCGCMRVCNTSLEPPRPPYERLMDARPLARAARPQCAKMCFFTT